MAERKEAKIEKDEAEKYQKLVREYVSVFFVVYRISHLQGQNAIRGHIETCRVAFLVFFQINFG